ncbi:U1 small nuclear ribonucleoprotein C [Neocloeon triangulifer]|uniref:U1 small nuclear ribonucleoprotein C n=1 Tax=Neocloeon triangulifer TaxID=2078957 RepID=UPI00286F4563|nr:U1 small nuclear ribonucleoprotein C [Neocloeon triangulifer]
MPKYYCDYCDTYLTHDSPSVRKTHCQGRKHKENVKFYYQKWMEEQAQHLIDATTAAFRAGKIPSNPFAAGKGAAIPPPNTQIPPPMGQRPPMPPPGMMPPGAQRPPMAPGPMGPGMPPGMVMAPGMPPMMPGMRPPMGPMGPMMHMPPMAAMGQMGAVRPPPLMGSALPQPMKKP